jgi:serine/threonine protein kinase
VVTDEVAPPTTGGAFSVCYLVKNRDGRTAFLKAFNFQAAATGLGTVADRMKQFLDAYVFERDLLKDCGGKSLSRIIALLDHGEIALGANVWETVPYLVLEQADGDARKLREAMVRLDCTWVCRTMKHVCLGLEQLHSAGATHQDLKLSNVLTQDDGREMKLGDLGRADRQGVPGPWSDRAVPGARSYAPPEQLYLGFQRTWEERKAGDMYLAGSLGVQLFTGHNLTALIQQRTPMESRAGVWKGTFPAVIPVLEHAHAGVISDLESLLRRESMNESIIQIYIAAIAQMTQPDPMKRGNPKDRAAKTSSYSFRRFVSLFNLIAIRSEWDARRAISGK